MRPGEQFCSMDGLTEGETVLFDIYWLARIDSKGHSGWTNSSYYKLRANTKFGLKVENDQVVLIANGQRVSPYWVSE